MMNGEVEASDTFGPLRVAAPGHAARTRAGLPPAVRAKLDALEGHALNTLAVVRAIGDRLAEVRTALVATEQRIVAAEAARSYRPVDLTDEHAALADEQERVATLTAQRDVAQERWRAANQVAEACRRYLGVAG